jgi:hypothetical protein
MAGISKVPKMTKVKPVGRVKVAKGPKLGGKPRSTGNYDHSPGERTF